MPDALFLDLTVRVGCHIVYETNRNTPVLLMVRPRLDDKQLVLSEQFTCTPHESTETYIDSHENQVHRWMLEPGQNILHYDALVSVSSLGDQMPLDPFAVPVQLLPPWTLRYTLPSRYCDTDKILNFAWNQFGYLSPGFEQVQAICNWVHFNIEYRYGSGRSDTSASDTLNLRYGVCRDFAHLAVALCRALNLPARYAVGHMPNIGTVDPGTPMDFHAYFEVYLGHSWVTFDARHNRPRIGRVKIAHGLDAVDTAFATLYGGMSLNWFEVWSYQVDKNEVKLGDPIDLSKRADSSVEVKIV